MRDEGTYEKKIRFYVVEVSSASIRQEIKGWNGLGDHGLVGTSASRQLKVMIPGHSFGRAQIVAKADELIRLTTTQPN